MPGGVGGQRREPLPTRLDWSLLVFFASLFFVTKSVETIGLSNILFKYFEIHSGSSIVHLTIVSAISSNLISNVPAVLLLRPFIETDTGWYTLVMATTLAGNLTLLGSIANLIVAESAKRQGIQLSFFEYLRVGVPVTIISLLAGVIWLSFVG
ncbi:MAG: SLC13 family permease [Bacteroidales bacterium]